MTNLNKLGNVREKEEGSGFFHLRMRETLASAYCTALATSRTVSMLLRAREAGTELGRSVAPGREERGLSAARMRSFQLSRYLSRLGSIMKMRGTHTEREAKEASHSKTDRRK